MLQGMIVITSLSALLWLVFFWKTSNIVHSKEMTLMITKMDPILFLNLFAPLWGWLLLQIHLVKSTGITRLECRYHANFSVRFHQKRYNDTPILKHENIKNISSCAVLCVTTSSCSFINYHSKSLRCELMHSFEYLYYDETKLQSAVNWEFAAPAYRRQQVRITFIIVLNKCTLA